MQALHKTLVTALFAVLVAVCAVPLVGAEAAHAADNGQWSVYPSSVPGDNGQVRPWFELDLRPGLTTTDSVAISNQTDAPMTFLLYASDATNLDNGTFGLVAPDKPKRDVGAWITLPGTELTVPPMSMVNLPFTIVVPQNATPGDHAGGIVAVNKAAAQQEAEASRGASGAIDVLNAVGTRVYARVEGPLSPSLRITDMSVDADRPLGSMFGASADVTVTYTVENTGNVRLTPTATGEVSSLFGISGEDLAERELPELLPGNHITVRERVSGIPPGVRITASVSLDAGEAHAAGEASAFAMPWLLLVVIVVLVAGAGFWRRRRGKRRTAALQRAAS